MTLKAAGEGSARGNTGSWREPPDGFDVAEMRGSPEQWAARTTLWTGKRKTCSLTDDFEATARTCVGCVGCADDDERCGTVNF